MTRALLVLCGIIGLVIGILEMKYPHKQKPKKLDYDYNHREHRTIWDIWWSDK